MDADGFDALSRSLSDARSRRGSLATLGGIALAATLLAPGVTEAKKRGGNKGKRKGKGKRECTPQDGQCRTALPGLCVAAVSSDSVDECVALLEPCCAFLHGCKLTEAFACARDVIAANR
jgi:hypothetical protein